MRTRKSLMYALSALAMLGVAACENEDEGPEIEAFVAAMTGAAEKPTAVTTTATGSARVEFTATGLTYLVTVTGIQNVTLGHIHGPASVDVAAGVILNLSPTTGSFATTTTIAQGTATTTNSTAIGMDSLKVLIRRGLTYVNIHNQANGSGHIRGQLTPAN